ncbi:MAG: hypothetical protein VYD75_03320, partial [Pseudomonadota bacterium]|nr:hypothetical protein [Pseudomonadota bacterium]
MAKRDTKKAAGLAKAGPSADQSGQAKSDSKEKTSSKRKWLYSFCLFLLAIIIGGGFVFFGFFPELRRSISLKFMDEIYFSKGEADNTNLTSAVTKIENENDKTLTSGTNQAVDGMKAVNLLGEQMEQISKKFSFLQQRVLKLENDYKEIDSRFSLKRLQRSATDEDTTNLLNGRNKTNSDNSISMKVQQIKMDLDVLRGQVGNKNAVIDELKNDIKVLTSRQFSPNAGMITNPNGTIILQISIGQLANAIATGRAFSLHLAVIQELAGENPRVAGILEELRPLASKGVKSKNFLRNDFFEKINRLSINSFQKETILGQLENRFKELVK